MVSAFKQRHDYLVKALNELPGVRCANADGTFYAFPDFGAVIARLDGVDDDVKFSEYLLNQAGVAVVPGSAFGAPGYARLSFATSLEVLKEAISRLHKALNH